MFSFMANTLGHLLRIFRVLHTVQFSRFFVVVSATACLLYHSFVRLSTTFLKFFSNRFRFASLSLKDKAYLITSSYKCQQLFVEIFQIVLTAYAIHFSAIPIVYFYHICIMSTYYILCFSLISPISFII